MDTSTTDQGAAGRGRVRSWVAEMVPAPGLPRRFAVLATVQALGIGLFLTSSAIFFVRTIGLTAGQVGIGLSVAGLIGLLFTVPIGRLADRIGPRRPLFAVYLLLGLLFAAYCFVRNFAEFVVVASLISVCETSCNPLRLAMARASLGQQERVRVGAQMRGLFNVSFSLGAVLAGVALAVGTRLAFVVVILGTAVLQLVCALVTARLRTPPHVRVRHEPGARSRSGLRNVRFVAIALLCGTLELYQPILVVALPLWIVGRTGAPAGVNSVLLVLDTVAVFALQVAMSKGSETIPGAARMLRRSGWFLAGCCVLFALSQGLSAAVAVPLLVVGTLVLVLGENSQAAGATGLVLHLPPPGRQGEYQGVFALGRGFQQTVGPALVTALAVGLGWAGWLVLGGVLLAAGFAVPPLARSAARHTTPDES
ncbi:MFS transporter [Amycolatopsis sp. NPDC054798]